MGKLLQTGLYILTPLLALGVGAIVGWHGVTMFALLLMLLGTLAFALGGRTGERSRRVATGMLLLVPMILGATVVLGNWENWTDEVDQLRYSREEGPSSDHPLGTDRYGRDILSVLGLAVAQSYLVACIGSVVAMALGLVLGLGASSRLAVARLGGKAICEYFETVPQVVFVVLAMAVVNLLAVRSSSGTLTMSNVLPAAGVAVGLACSPMPARLVQRRFEELQSLPFVRVLQSYGVKNRTIRYRSLLLAHVLPDLLHEVGIVFATALVLESAVAYVYEVRVAGLGAGGYASLGQLLAQLRSTILFASPPALPGLAAVLGVTVMSIAGAFVVGGAVAQSGSSSGVGR